MEADRAGSRSENLSDIRDSATRELNTRDGSGYPQFRDHLTTMHPDMLPALLRLLVLGRDLCSSAEPKSDLETIVRQIAIKCLNSAEASQTLIWNGMGADANVINRTILEAYFVGAYLELKPGLCSDFLQFVEVKIYKHFLKRKEAEGDPVAANVQEALDCLESAFQDWKNRGMPTTNWCKTNLRDMAQAIDLSKPTDDERYALQQYDGSYRTLSSFTHSDGLAFYLGDEFGTYPTGGQFPGSVGDLLFGLVSVLSLLDRVTGLDRDVEIAEAVNAVRATLPGLPSSENAT